MQQLSVAVLDPFHPRTIETLRSALPSGWALRIAASDSFDDQAAALGESDMAFIMAAPVPARLLERASRLRFIQKLGAGVDRIDIGFCAESDIAVARLYAGNAIPVAEHTLMLILSAYRRLPLLDRNTRAGRWEKENTRGTSRHLHGKTVGIVGFGAIGRALARLLSGFGVQVLYYDPARAAPEAEAELSASWVSLDELVSRCDVLSLHLPLSKDTAGIIDARRIAAMKPQALLVNCARGGLVDETALAEALAEGRLFGAALDAFAQEPPVGSPLLALQNTIVTPHCAGATLDNFAKIAARAVDNAQRFMAGQPLPADDIVVLAAAPAATG